MSNKLMTALLNDGSQITGVEVSRSMHDDEVILSCDGEQIPVNLLYCFSYYEETDPQFDELTQAESEELDMCDLSSLLVNQAY